MAETEGERLRRRGDEIKTRADFDVWLHLMIRWLEDDAQRERQRGLDRSAARRSGQAVLAQEMRERLAQIDKPVPSGPAQPEGEAGRAEDVAVSTARLALDSYYSHGIRNDAVDVGYDAAALVAAIRAQPAPAGLQAEGAGGEPISGSLASTLPLGSLIQWEHDRTDGGLRMHTPVRGWEPPLDPRSLYRVISRGPSLPGGYQPPAPTGPRGEDIEDFDRRARSRGDEQVQAGPKADAEAARVVHRSRDTGSVYPVTCCGQRGVPWTWVDAEVTCPSFAPPASALDGEKPT